MHQTISIFSRYMSRVSVYGILLLCFMLAPLPVLADMPLLAMDGKKIVTASSVRYRAAPSLHADIVGKVGLGAVLHATRRTKEKLQTGELNSYWYLISAGEKQGWISGHFLRDFKPDQKEKIWFKIIRERMDNPDLSFVDRVALYRFVDVIVNKSVDASSVAETEGAVLESDKLNSAFELGRLLALQKSFDLVNWENVQKEPYQSWAKEHEAAQRVFRDEISGQWLVPSMDYWKLADKYQGHQGSDEISWYAANAQLGGECEGDIECNLSRDRMTQGEYLKRHPHGRHAGRSLKRLAASLAYIEQALVEQPDYFREFKAAGEVIDELFELIASANPKLEERAVALRHIKAIRRTFRQADS